MQNQQVYLVPGTCKNYTPMEKVSDEHQQVVDYSRSCMSYNVGNVDSNSIQSFAACAIPEGGFPPLTGRYLSCGEYSDPKRPGSHDKIVVCTFGTDQTTPTTCPASSSI